jgi:hypothetical protein
MRLKLKVENIETGEVEDVLVGLAVLRHYEEAHGKPALPEVDKGFVGPIIELAARGHNRKHGRTLSLDDWEDLYEVVSVDAGGQPDHPSDPATAPPSD